MTFKWKVKLILDEIDVSEKLTNLLRIEIEEGTAKIAEFSLIPHAGHISVSKWTGKSVEIYFISNDIENCLFKGVVDEPIYDPTTKVTSLVCSDQLQEKIQRLQKSEIDKLIVGYWSPVIFDSNSDNWTYVQDVLSTIPYCLDLDKENDFHITSWQAKINPDFTFDEDSILYQSIEVQLANRRELHNQTNITFQYRYQRLKQRDIHYGYGYPLTFCEQMAINATLPNVDMISQAVSGTGWLLKGNIVYEHQRGPGWVDCGHSSFGFLIKDELRKYLVRDAKFTLSKRFTQTVTENYQIMVQAPQSVSAFGLIDANDNLSYEVTKDLDNLINIKQYLPPITDSSLDTNGDYVYEFEDRNALNHAMTTKLNQVKTSILKSHRNNLINFKTTLCPKIERHHTIKIDTMNVKAQGKVKHIVHECDFNQGSCLTTITIAVSRTDSDVYVRETPLQPPHKLNLLAEKGNPILMSLPTHLGGKTTSPEFDDKWDGYSGNQRIEPNAKPFPERFAITTPSLESAQSPIDISHQLEYDIAIPNEHLALMA